MKRVLLAAASICLVGCGPKAPDSANNDGAKAWLAHHNGSIPNRCIVEMVENYGESTSIDENARTEAQERAMQLAGETYELSVAHNKLVSALERVLAVIEDGFAQGFETSQSVSDAKSKLNDAIFKWELSRIELAGLESCEFTATDAQFGFRMRSQVRY